MAYAIHTLCVLSEFKTEFSRTAIESCLNVLARRPSEMVTNLMLNGISYVLVSNPEALYANETPVVMQIVGQILADACPRNDMLLGTASTLYLTMSLIFEFTTDELAEVLRRAKFVVDDDDIPFIARFLWKALTRSSRVIEGRMKDMLAVIFSSGLLLLKMIPLDVVMGLAGLARGIADEELWTLVKGNQRHFVQIIRNRDHFSS
jgi:hypothetical protein